MVTIKRDIVNAGHGYLAPFLLAVHSTANPGATARNHRDLWSRGYDYAVHLTSDWTEAYQCVEYDRLCWQVGGGNGTCIGIEICEATNPTDFARGFDIAAQVCAQVLVSRGWNTSVMHPHLWFSQTYGGSDHTDPFPYFTRYGKSWADFVNLTQQYLNGGGIMAISDSDAKKIAEAVWHHIISGTQAWRRLQGVDQVCWNEVRPIISKITRVVDMLLRTDSTASGMLDANGKPNKADLWTRLDWMDKRIRDLNPNPSSKRTQTTAAMHLTDDTIDTIVDKIADKVIAKTKAAAPTTTPQEAE